MRTLVGLFCSIVFLLPTGMAVSADEPPYPASSIIRSVSFDFDTHISLAPGSDNWPVTWADNTHCPPRARMVRGRHLYRQIKPSLLHLSA